MPMSREESQSRSMPVAVSTSLPEAMSLAGVYLQHLDERNTQIEVSHISADQTEAEEQANWQDSSRVSLTVHRHLVS